MSTGENVFASPERWAEPARDGGFILTDPLSGDRMNPNAPPAWIEEDPSLYAGASFLRSYPDLAHVSLAFGRHVEAEDLGDPAKGWFEKKVAEADYFGDEDLGHTDRRRRSDVQITKELFTRSIPFGATLEAFLQVAREAGTKASTFELRQSRASLLAATTDTYSFDIAADGRPIERRLFEAFQAIKQAPSTPEAGIALAGLHNAREWVAVLKTGLTVLKGAQQRGFSPAEVFKTIGAAHKDIRRKYCTLGVETRSFLLRESAWQTSPVVTVFNTIGATSRIPGDYAALLAKQHDVAKPDGEPIA